MDDVSFIHGMGAGTRSKTWKIVVVIDSCPAHPPIDWIRAMRLVFLPPNTQPKHQGITANFNKKFMSASNKNEPYAVTVLDALRLIWQAWALVKLSTIVHCFAHCRFKQQGDTRPGSVSGDQEDDLSLYRLLMSSWQQINL